MTCYPLFVPIILFTLILIISVVRDRILFSKYCERISELEGRANEFRLLSASEGGMNWFEIEHVAKLWQRYHLKFDDRLLWEMGNTLFRRGALNLLLMILLIASIVLSRAVNCSF